MKILSRSDMLLTVWILNTFESADFSPYIQNLVISGNFLFSFSFFEFKKKKKSSINITWAQLHTGMLLTQNQFAKVGSSRVGRSTKKCHRQQFWEAYPWREEQTTCQLYCMKQWASLGTGDYTGLPAARSTQAAQLFHPTLRGRETRGLEMWAGDSDSAAKH